MSTETPIRGPVERLLARPWRIMSWTYPTDGPRYAVCVDALATWGDALREAARREGAWVESADPLKSATPDSR